jgi:glycosyltransferase involved in cell wall biosynthesis
MTAPGHAAVSTSGSAALRRPRRILMACPWGPVGGGMYRVVDYLMRQPAKTGDTDTQLEGLDTRGQGSALSSLRVLARALHTVWRGHRQGDLAGVHIHLAERMSLLRKAVLMLACKGLRVPMMVHLHAAQFPQFYERLPGLARWLTRHLLQLPPLIVVLGPRSQAFVVDTLKVPAERVRMVPNGVPAASRPRLRSASMRTVLFVGNLSERKGVGDLLRALRLPGWDRTHTRIVLAGGGDVQGYRQQAQALGLGEWVEWTGWVEREQVAALMAAADVLVLPSYDEGLPLVILEAMAQSVAVVCTPVGEIDHWIQDGEHAVFVAPGDVEALAQHLQRLLADDALRERLAQAGQRLHADEFSMSRFGSRIGQLHRECFGTAANEESPGRARAK